MQEQNATPMYAVRRIPRIVVKWMITFKQD